MNDQRSGTPDDDPPEGRAPGDEPGDRPEQAADDAPRDEAVAELAAQLEDVAGEPGHRPVHWQGLLPFVRDVARLLRRLSQDDRVPRRSKIVAGTAAAYLVSPVSPVPNFVPIIGWFDDVAVVGFAIRHLVKHAGYDILHELWEGSEDGFALLLFLGGVER